MKFKEIWCDGDIWAYQFGFKSQDEDGIASPFFLAKADLDAHIASLKDKFGGGKLIITLTDTINNFRKDIAVTEPYKGGRKSDKPVHWAALRKHMKGLPNTIVSVNEEADDIMSKALIRGGEDVVCVSVDKDLKNTQGWHYNDRREELVYVNPSEALHNFYTQLLVGDSVDNIKGCKGVGKVKATKLLEGVTDVSEYEKLILNEYEKAGHPKERMIEMGQLLWMRRVDDEMWNLESNGFSTIL